MLSHGCQLDNTMSLTWKTRGDVGGGDWRRSGLTRTRNASPNQVNRNGLPAGSLMFRMTGLPTKKKAWGNNDASSRAVLERCIQGCLSSVRTVAKTWRSAGTYDS
ncbi:uncharacterized protein LOC121047880 [Ixodes scapularis]|uniref:uncharacterized protein LOC121047880 n=1 Tax=Ixodes scapularis TaxID=6945 RepID=UPI001C381C73|nr:uncharacterized protein LOC121047880 [Ixodes scapularis]